MIHNEKHKMPLIFNRYKKYILWSTLIVLCVLILIPAIHLLRTKLNQQLPQVPLAAGYSNDASQLNLTKVSLYTTNFTEPLSYQGSAFLKLPKFP